MNIALVVLLTTLNASGAPIDSVEKISEPMDSMEMCMAVRADLKDSKWFHEMNAAVPDNQKVEAICQISGIEKELIAGTFDWSKVK